MPNDAKIGGPGGLTIKGWRIYYGDGSVVSSKDSTWQDAPNDDVQALIVFYNETYAQWDGEGKNLLTFPYRTVYCLQDYYWELGAGTATEALGHEGIKTGKLMPDDEWKKLYRERIHPDLVF